MMITVALGFFAVFLVVYLSMGMGFLAGLFFPNRPKSTAQPPVSVIVAARNEAAVVRTTLDGLAAQTYPQDHLEILLVDDRSEDETGSLMEEWASGRPNVRCLRLTDKPPDVSGKKNALDAAIRKAQGEILIFTDADCAVKPTWVSSLVAHFDWNVGFVIGFSSIRASSFFEKWQRFDFLTMMAAAAGAANLGVPMAASGQNMAYRKEAFLEAGGFESIKHRLSGDDVLMMHKIRSLKKWRVVFASDAGSYVSTRPETTLGALLRQRARWASNADMMLRMNPLFLVYLLSVYGLTAMLLVGLTLVTSSSFLFLCVLFGWVNKFIVDIAVSSAGHRCFHEPFSFAMFLAWFITQPFYLLWVGLQGSLRLFYWK